MMKGRVIATVFCTLMMTVWINGIAFSVEPDEILDDPVLEARARSISEHLRCLVCQNENIDSSNAGLAKDLRVLVRERLVAGDSDEEVVAFVVDRYGDYVLLKPPLKSTTIVLWLSPILLLMLAGAIVVVVIRSNNSRVETASLNEDEERRLKDLVEPVDHA